MPVPGCPFFTIEIMATGLLSRCVMCGSTGSQNKEGVCLLTKTMIHDDNDFLFLFQNFTSEMCVQTYLHVPVGALRICPCIAESRDRRTDAAWSNSSGTKRPGTGQYYVYPRKITDQHTYTTHSTDSTNEHQQQIYIQQYSKQIKRGLVRTEP